MLDFLAAYGLFLAKGITVVILIVLLIAAILGLASRGKKSKDKLEVQKLNEKYEDMADALVAEILPKKEYKKHLKQEKKIKKSITEEKRKRIFVVNFIGDIRASEVSALREEVTAILTVATPNDEVMVLLDSTGGMVHAYGLAAAQLVRIREKGIPLIVSVDKVAASGGYLMACVANKIIAAPFAIIGSIGVVAQLPNFNRLLKKNYIDFELITAGEFKRTLTLFGENTEKARKKLQEEIEDIHSRFKDFIQQYRSQLNIDSVATGEHWLAKRAFELRLVDEILTSDDYLLAASKISDLYEVTYCQKKSLAEKLTSVVQSTTGKLSNMFYA